MPSVPDNGPYPRPHGLGYYPDSPARPERLEDTRTGPAVLIRFYDDDHGPCGSYRLGPGVSTVPVPVDTEEMTAELVLPEPGLAGATDAEVLFAAERLVQRYGNAETNGPLLSLARQYLTSLAERARDLNEPSPAGLIRKSDAKRDKP